MTDTIGPATVARDEIEIVDDPLTADQLRLRAALPGYEVKATLGRGAMGEVLGGRHVRLDRAVAIKRLPPSFAGDPAVRARFAAEAKVLAALDHPHVVPVYDYVEDDGLCLLVMQSLTGGTVWDRFTTEGITMPAACAVVVAACAGLQHAHDRRVLHRDVKPDNLMFDEEHTLKVTDFGIATALSGSDTLATLDGEVLGTPAYMAPEQADGRTVGPPADVYAAGTMLYELLSGRLPFPEDGGVVELLRRRVDEEPAPLRSVANDVPEPIAAVVMRAIARDPADRFPSAEALGVAVADAAAEAWGPSWLAHADLKLLASGAIGAAAGRATTAPSPPTATPGEVRAPAEVESRATAPPSGRDTGAPRAGVVRPTVTHRRAAADLADVDPAELVRVADLLEPPEVPRRELLATGALALLALLVAAVGLGSPARQQAPVAAGAVVVDGVDVSDGGGVGVDLGEPVPVEVRVEADGPLRARLSTSAAGLPAGTSSTEVLEEDGSRHTGVVFTRSLRVVASGELTAELTVLDADDDVVLRHDFRLEPDRPVWLSAGGLLVSVLVLFVAAFAASVSKPFRLGRRRPSAYVGATLLGVATGVALQVAAWSLGAPEPTPIGLAVVVVAATSTFVLGAWCLFRLGRRRRLLALRTD